MRIHDQTQLVGVQTSATLGLQHMETNIQIGVFNRFAVANTSTSVAHV